MQSFFMTPHRWTSVQQMEDGVSRFLRSRDTPKTKVEHAKCLAKAIIAINTAFLQTRTLNRVNVVNMFSISDDLQEKVCYHNFLVRYSQRRFSKSP
jgi:hypothetical protein